LLVAIFLAYLAGLVVKQQMLRQRSEQLSREIRTEVRAALGEIPGVRDPDELLDRLRSAVDLKRRELQDLRGTKSRSVLDVLKELSEIIPEEMEVELGTFTITDTKTGAVLIIGGTANTNEDIVKIEENLKNSPSFGEVRGETVRQVAGGKRYRFKFKVDFRES
jgi:hypothetical protein